MNKFLSILLLIMLGVTGAAVYFTQSSKPVETVVGKASVGGQFTLNNMHNTPVSDSQFRGKKMLVFFGFTHCPDVCPLTMATITRTFELLGAKAESYAPVFITVDPARDTPERLKEYLSHFDKRIMGLTGNADQIKAVASAYKAYYSEAPKPAEDHSAHGANHADMDHSKMDHGSHDAKSADNYLVDHSSYIYLMNEQGEYVTHFAYTIDPEELAKKLAQEVAQ